MSFTIIIHLKVILIILSKQYQFLILKLILTKINYDKINFIKNQFYKCKTKHTLNMSVYKPFVKLDVGTNDFIYVFVTDQVA